MGQQQAIRLFQTLEHACGYWPDRLSRDLIVDPTDPQLPLVFPQALAMGFRRSGGHVYRPYCIGCRACISVRIPVQRFCARFGRNRCTGMRTEMHARQPMQYGR